MSRISIYTTAPAAYDGFSTREELAEAGRDGGKIVRRVSMEPRDKQWQIDRYASGMHCALLEDSWRDLVAKGICSETEQAPAVSPELASKVVAAAVALFQSVPQVNQGVWQVPHTAMQQLMRAVQATGVEF